MRFLRYDCGNQSLSSICRAIVRRRYEAQVIAVGVDNVCYSSLGMKYNAHNFYFIRSTLQYSEGGKKLNQAMVNTGKAVATTGRAVGTDFKHISS